MNISNSDSEETSSSESDANIEKFKESLDEAFCKLSNEIDNVSESSKILADYGWFVPFSFHPSTINQSAEKLKLGDSGLVNKLMIKFFDENINWIKNDLEEKFPHRKKPIISGINAHQEQKYYLSIPVFFSQAEGVCKELTNKRFFSTHHKKPVTKGWTSEFEDDVIMKAVLEPLKHKGKVRNFQKPENPIGINRHDVLHGNSVDYGDNKLNSYKTLSLLFYLCDTVYEASKSLELNSKK